MERTHNKKSKFFSLTALFLLLTVVLGRLVSWFYSIVATDVAYADWLYSLMGYLNEILPCLRTAVSYASVGAAVYFLPGKNWIGTFSLSVAAAFLDYGARFVIDLSSGSLLGTEAMALIWLSLQLLYELIFLVLALLIILMMHRKSEKAQSSYAATKYRCTRAVRYGLVLVLLSRIAMEGYYLVDFLLTYSDITGGEIASIVGSFLKILVIYGGIAFLTAAGMHALYKKSACIPAKQTV